jgi:tape measure domain-containing protein
MADFADLVVKLELQQAAFQKGMDQAARQLARVQQNAKGAQSAMGGLEAGLNGVAQAAGAAAAAFGTLKGVEAIVKAADSVRNLQGSFTALLGDASRAGDMLQRVFAIVDRTGAPLEAVGAATQRLTIALTGLGASNNQIATITETFIKLAKVGGSSAEETAAGLQQLGQALASGKLGGDELKSIRENAPLVAEAIAKGMGVTTGALKQLGEDGKLTADVVGNALIAASDSAAAAFAKLPQGFEQATNKMVAQATLAASEFDKVGGTTQTLVTTVNFIADTFKRWREELASTNAELNTTQILVQSVNDLGKLFAVAFVAVSFALEQIIKRTAFWAEQIKLMIDLDWSGVLASSDRFRQQMEASADAANATINALLRARDVAPFGKVVGGDEETGGQPQIPARKLKPAPGGGGGGGKGGKSEAEKEAEALKKRGEALAAAVDAQEAYNQKLREYDELLGKGAITQEIFEKAVAKANKERTAEGDAIKALVDPYEAHRQTMEKINELYKSGAIEIEHWLELMEQADKKLKDETKKEKTELEKLEEAMAGSIGKSIGEFFGDLISGTMTVSQAFSKMVESIIRDLAKLLAEFAAKAITKAILSFLPGGGVTGAGAPAGLTLASRPTTWNPAASLAGPLALGAPRAGGVPGETTGGAASSGSPWNVTINNNAPGVEVTARPRSDGGLEVAVDRVRQALAQDVARGGNPFSRSLESAYGLGRGAGR